MTREERRTIQQHGIRVRQSGRVGPCCCGQCQQIRQRTQQRVQRVREEGK